MTQPPESLSAAFAIASLGETGRVRCEVGWRLSREWSVRLQDHDLWTVWAGEGRMMMAGRQVELRPGTVIWMRPGEIYAAEQNPSARLGVTFIHFTPHGPRGWKPPFNAMETSDVPLLEAMTRAIIKAQTSSVGVAKELLRALLLTLADEATQSGDLRPSGTERRHRELVQELARQIREDPGRAPTVSEMARSAGYSVDHFSRVFAEVAGLSPQAYVRRARIERAQQLLRESSLTISEIAAALGYADVYFFSRQFRQVAGMAPTHWRRKS